MWMKCGLGLSLALISSVVVLSQMSTTSKKTEQHQTDITFRSRATIAVLPGNPFDSRLYSMQRNVLTREFISRLTNEYSIDAAALSGLSIKYQPESSFVVSFADDDMQTATAVVKTTMNALVREMESRSAADRNYGNMHIKSPVIFDATDGRPRAEGVLVMDGIRWGQAEKRETDARITALMGVLSDLETLRIVVRQWSSRTDTDAVAGRVRSSISFRRLNDSWVEVTLLAPDVAFLQRLLDYAPKEKIGLEGRLPLADIDFVPRNMRNDWYIFNCCQTTPL
jgi:hypothetical protein